MEITHQPKGLINGSSFCYMNAVVQIMNTMFEVTTYIEEQVSDPAFALEEELALGDSRTPVVRKLHSILSQLSPFNNSSSIVDARSLLQVLPST